MEKAIEKRAFITGATLPRTPLHRASAHNRFGRPSMPSARGSQLRVSEDLLAALASRP